MMVFCFKFLFSGQKTLNQDRALASLAFGLLVFFCASCSAQLHASLLWVLTFSNCLFLDMFFFLYLQVFFIFFFPSLCIGQQISVMLHVWERCLFSSVLLSLRCCSLRAWSFFTLHSQGSCGSLSDTVLSVTSRNVSGVLSLIQSPNMTQVS